MRKIIVFVVLVAIFALPGLGILPAGAACSYIPSAFVAGDSGHVAQSFSTLRTAIAGPGTRILAPAEFTVNSVTTVNCHNWVNITYTSGVDEFGVSAAGRSGFALESQDYYDGTYGPGTWLALGSTPEPVPGTCEFSYGTAFESADPSAPIDGEIAQVFSTLRSAPGAAGTRVLAPATFFATDQVCVGGFSWVYITYVDGVDVNGNSVAQQSGWALESQTFFDGTFGPGTWLIPTVTDGAAAAK
jgi:hypothetical protein